MNTQSAEDLLHRCAGPNCGRLKGNTDHWWLMWTTSSSVGTTVLSFSAWDESLARSEAALHLCGEQCAAKLLSQFMSNILQARQKSAAR